MGFTSFQKSQKSLEELKENIMLHREKQTVTIQNLPKLKSNTDLNVASSVKFQSITYDSSEFNAFD
jgi:hypothetical protein